MATDRIKYLLALFHCSSEIFKSFGSNSATKNKRQNHSLKPKK